VYSELTPDDRQRKCPKHVEFHEKLICEISASSWFYYKENIFQNVSVVATFPVGGGLH